MQKSKKPGSQRKKIALLISLVLILTTVLGTTLAFIVTQAPSLINIFKPSPEGGVIIRKMVEHPYGDDYQIPDNISFDLQVVLGEKYANKAVDVIENGTEVEKTADASGMITAAVKPNSSVAIYDLAEGTVVTVTEVQKENDGFEVADSIATKEVTIPNKDNIYVDFVNKYTPEKVQPVNLNVSGTKNLSGRDWKEGDFFTFQLEYQIAENTDEWEVLGTKTVTYELVKDDATNTMVVKPDFNKFDFSDLIQAMDYDQAGTYAFRVSEVSGTIGGVTYDSVVSYFDVIVGDANMDGYLEIQNVIGYQNATASKDDTAGQFNVSVAINNEYAPEGSAEILLNIKKKLEDLSGQNKTSEGFSFGLYDESGVLLETSEETSAVGEAVIKRIYDAKYAGQTFTYTIKEIGAGQTVNGLTYDSTEYKICVSVIDNLDGTVSAVVYDYAETVPEGADHTYSATFKNTYDPQDATVILTGNKELTGRDIKEGEFAFQLYETENDFALAESAQPIQTAANTKDGTLTFTELSYDKIGTHYYVIKEDDSAQLGGVTYDDAKFYVTVTVTDQGGVLEAAKTVTDKAGKAVDIKFKNTYEATDAKVKLEGKKTLTDLELRAEAFAFDLYETTEKFEAKDSPVQKVKNDLNGKFIFDELTYTEEGTWYYLIKEDSTEPLNGVTYDETEYRVTVKVEDDEKGSLKAETTVLAVLDGQKENVESILFENSYAAENVTLAFSGQKVLEGATLTDGMFRFELYEADDKFVAEKNTLRAAVNNDEGVFAFNALTYTEEGTYYYVVKEDASQPLDRIKYDETMYGITVVIEDNGEGNLVVADETITVIDGEETEEILFTNTYVPAAEDATVDITAKKTVKSTGAETIGPEGFEFVLENVTTGKEYKVKSDEKGLAVFTLVFTEEDDGQVYDFALKEVNDGREKVTYSTNVYEFQITVEADKENKLLATVTHANEVVEELVCEFENIYGEGTVTPGEPGQPDQPGGNTNTGDKSPIGIYVALMIESAIAVVLVLMLRKHKKQQENPSE